VPEKCIDKCMPNGEAVPKPTQVQNYTTIIRPSQTFTERPNQTTSNAANPMPPTTMNPIYSNVGCRRSASMESIPSQLGNVQLQIMNTQHQMPNNNTNNNNKQHIVNIYNKYGTVGGYSINSNTNKHTNHHRPSLLIQKPPNDHQNHHHHHQQQQHQQLLPPNIQQQSLFNTNNLLNNNSNSTVVSNNNNNSVGVGTSSENSQINSRLRAVNRSFRTAVDKSFDLPNQPNSSGKFNGGNNRLFIFYLIFYTHKTMTSTNKCNSITRFGQSLRIFCLSPIFNPQN
jgi:hypothetical protein